MNTTIKKMIAAASDALIHSYSPYSHFSVASCIITNKGNLYTGVNVENASYGLTICAEVSAICKMVTAGERQIDSIVVLAGNNLLCSPCGSCRQRIHEFSTTETSVHLCNKDSLFQSFTIDELLPLAFVFKPQ